MVDFKKYPEAAKDRDLIIFGRPGNYLGGIERFSKLSLSALRKLFVREYIDPDDSQNGSPTASEYLGFMEDHSDPSWTVHGYVVSPKRGDCRVTIEGCEKDGAPTIDEIIDFVRMFRDANEFEVKKTGLYCWYD